MTHATTYNSCVRPARTTRPMSFWARTLRVMSLSRQRRALADLDPHLLRDIGVTRSEATQEAARPLWDAPNHWQQ